MLRWLRPLIELLGWGGKVPSPDAAEEPVLGMGSAHPESYGWKPGMRCQPRTKRYVAYAVRARDFMSFPECDQALGREVREKGRYFIYQPTGEPMQADTIDELKQQLDENEDYLRGLEGREWALVYTEDFGLPWRPHYTTCPSTAVGSN